MSYRVAYDVVAEGYWGVHLVAIPLIFVAVAQMRRMPSFLRWAFRIFGVLGIVGVGNVL